MKIRHSLFYILFLLFISNSSFALDDILINNSFLESFSFVTDDEDIEFNNSTEIYKFFGLQNTRTISSSFSNISKEKLKLQKKIFNVFWDFKNTIEDFIKNRITEIISNSNLIHVLYSKTDIIFPFHHFL
jgi:hypothetical protein